MIKQFLVVNLPMFIHNQNSLRMDTSAVGSVQHVHPIGGGGGGGGGSVQFMNQFCTRIYTQVPQFNLNFSNSNLPKWVLTERALCILSTSTVD